MDITNWMLLPVEGISYGVGEALKIDDKYTSRSLNPTNNRYKEGFSI